MSAPTYRPHPTSFVTLACITALLLTSGCDENARAGSVESASSTASSSETSQAALPDPEPAASPPSKRGAAKQPPAGQAAAATPARTSPLALGDAAPATDVEMKNVDGKRVTIESVRGDKGTLVVFTCNHCPWAKAWHARLTKLGNDYGKRGIGVIAINPNDPAEYPDDGFEAMQERARSTGMEFPYVVDATSDVARAYGATKTPEAFLFDRDLELVYHGAIDDNAHEEEQVSHRYLRDALDALAKGTEIPVAQTRALGCSIKFRQS